MKKIVLAVISLFFLSPAAVSAEYYYEYEGGSCEESNYPGEIIPTHSWEVGTEISYIRYKEPDVMEEDGVMYGVVGSYRYRRNNLVIQLEGKGSWGEVDYDSETTGTIDGVTDYMLETRALLGYDLSDLEAIAGFGPYVTLIPYAGLGYRHLNDDMGGETTSTGHAGYERISHYYYSPIGVEVSNTLDVDDPGNEWSLTLILEYDYFWDGTQDSNLSTANVGYENISNDQDDGYGCRGYIKLRRKSENLDISIAPFFKYWNIEKSDDANIIRSGMVWGYAYEPKNHSMEYGLQVTANF